MARKNKDVPDMLEEYHAEKTDWSQHNRQRNIDFHVNMSDDFAETLKTAEILKVCVYDEQLAMIIAKFGGANTRNPYDTRWLKKIDGKWLNNGNDRFDSPDIAIVKFAQRAENEVKKTDVKQAEVITTIKPFLNIAGLKHYRVDKRIADFPADKVDLSTPEASYATQKNLIVSSRKDKFEQLSKMTVGRPQIPERERRGMEGISADWAKTYREQFVVFEVLVLDDKHAFVFGLRRFDMLYDGNFFEKQGDEWLNRGNDQSMNVEDIAKRVQQGLSQWATASETRESATAPSATVVPTIIKMEPANGATDVDATTVKELRVTFDIDMNTGGMSWTGGGAMFPQSPDGMRPKWIDNRTCVLPVELEPGKTYQLGINAPRFQNFRSAAGVPVVPVIYTFATAGQAHLLEVEKSDWFGKLNERQKNYVRWDENQFAYVYNSEKYNVGDARDEFERRWLDELAKPEPGFPGMTLTPYVEAITGLAKIKSDKALEPLLKIATERVIKDNAHRHYATKALSMLGDPAAVPELIPLVYHFNMNTRWDAQVALVRLTGQNFGADAQAWGEWYMANRDKLGKDLPAFDSAPVDWIFGSDNTELKHWSDPKVQEEFDKQRFGGQ